MKKQKKPKMNIRLLRKIQRTIMKRANQFEMDLWFSRELHLGWNEVHRPAGGCGYAACVAGWAIALSSKAAKINLSKWYTQRTTDYRYCFSQGKELIGLTNEQAHRLFMLDGWPEPFLTGYNAAMKPATRARIACKRIDHFIKTKGES